MLGPNSGRTDTEEDSKSIVDQDVQADTGILSIQRGGRFRYAGPHHWACISRRVNGVVLY